MYTVFNSLGGEIMRTIKLDGNVYSLDKGVVYTSFVENDSLRTVSTKYRVGSRAILVSRTDVSPNALRRGSKPNYYLSFDLDGVGGNSNRDIKRTSGWRGTTNDISVDAYGIVKITKIKLLHNGNISVGIMYEK